MAYISNTNLPSLLDNLKKDYDVYVPVKKGEQRFYRKYTEPADDIVIGEVRAFEPLKAFFTRAREKVAENFTPDIPHSKDRPIAYQYAKQSSEQEPMDYLEFIAKTTSHIPDKGQVMVRYYGLYSNAHRGKMRREEVDPAHLPIIEEDHFVPSRGWAEMIRKVYEVDPLLCPRCGGQMRVIAFIEDHKVIDKIIRHLKLIFTAERPPPPQVVQQELLMAAEEREEYF